MAASPEFKVYGPDGDYRGALKDPSEAAAVVALLGFGATIRHGHAKRDTVYTNGPDGDASESYDAVAVIVWERLATLQRERYARVYGPGGIGRRTGS